MSEHKIYIKNKSSPQINDIEYFNNIELWAISNCPGFIGVDVVDVSDTSLTDDYIACFTFSDSKDVSYFYLKWF